MKICVLPAESGTEKRLALVPATVRRLSSLGFTVAVPNDYGAPLSFTDENYEEAGAVVGSVAQTMADSNFFVTIAPPSVQRVRELPETCTVVGMLDPFFEHELVRELADSSRRSVALELIPRSTYAQKMDVLSSQASLAGYSAVVLAAERSHKVFPMMSTPAGTIQPARVLVVGAGVAGLQAIATARRLGARVEAYDTRPVVKEQVESLGARFVELDLGELGQTEQGYAKELTKEQLVMQQEQLAKYCAQVDVLITTAQVFGRSAPQIITDDMVASMKPGAVIVDLAASTGGNVAGTVFGEEVTVHNGVRIIGHVNLPGQAALDASAMFASNVFFLFEHLLHEGEVRFADDDDIAKAVLLTDRGRILDDRVKSVVEAEA